MSLPRELDPVEIRILGCLLEKERTTPDAYPLSVNALVSACNQRSSREPVMSLTAGEVQGALDRLHEEVLVWPVSGARTEKWRHSLERRLELDPSAAAILSLLFLRGPQTAGEIRARSDRLHAFADTSEVEATLLAMSDEDRDLVALLERRPGQKECRWTHLAGGRPTDCVETPVPVHFETSKTPSLTSRVADLEERVAALEDLLKRR